MNTTNTAHVGRHRATPPRLTLVRATTIVFHTVSHVSILVTLHVVALQATHYAPTVVPFIAH